MLSIFIAHFVWAWEKNSHRDKFYAALRFGKVYWNWTYVCIIWNKPQLETGGLFQPQYMDTSSKNNRNTQKIPKKMYFS